MVSESAVSSGFGLRLSTQIIQIPKHSYSLFTLLYFTLLYFTLLYFTTIQSPAQVQKNVKA
jgi:hypothetical protein